MAGVYDGSKADALALLTEFGTTATLRRYRAGAPVDPAEPWRPGNPTATNATARVVFDQRRARTDGTRTDIAYLAASGLAFAPAIGDRLVVNGLERGIASVETLAPSGDPILYTLELEAWPAIERP